MSLGEGGREEEMGDLRGRETWPETSLLGAMGVLLYGILGVVWETRLGLVGWMMVFVGGW